MEFTQKQLSLMEIAIANFLRSDNMVERSEISLYEKDLLQKYCKSNQ